MKNFGCIASINSIGLAYLEGHVPEKISKCQDTAIKYFNIAASKKFVYAINNLGLIFEKNKEYEKAFSYFLQSANLEESWAANRVGEYYRLGYSVEKDMSKAFEYYTKSASASIHGICLWSKFNLAKYFYKDGNVEALVEKDFDKALELFKQCSVGGIEEATKELESL